MLHALPATLGPSELVGTYADGSPEWHRQRSTGIGGSDIASILQIDGAFTGRYKLWLQKHGDIEPEPLTDWQRRTFASGHALEPCVAAEFSRAHPELEVYLTGSWRRSDKEWALSNPDRLLYDPVSERFYVLEIKTSEYAAAFIDGMPPAKYVAQLRWYMGNLGITRGFMALQTGLSGYSEWVVPLDINEPVVNMETGNAIQYPQSYDDMLKAAEFFVWSLIRNNPPPVDNTWDTHQFMRSRHPEIDVDKSVEIPVELAQRLHRTTELAKKWDAESRLAKTEILDLLADAKNATVLGVKVAYRQAGYGRTPSLYLARGKAVQELVAETQPQAA